MKLPAFGCAGPAVPVVFAGAGNDASDGGAAATGGSRKRKRFPGELAFCHIGKDSRFHILTVKAVSVRPYNFGLRIGHRRKICSCSGKTPASPERSRLKSSKMSGLCQPPPKSRKCCGASIDPGRCFNAYTKI